MKAINLKCTQCGTRESLKQTYSCKKCGGILEVEYDYSDMPNSLSLPGVKGLWRFAHLLPVNPEFNTTLGEGDTPLLKAKQLRRWAGVENIYLKNEGCNPTGAFKDRPMTVGISKALEMGAQTVITASSGNGGASLAAYASRFGLKSVVVVPVKTPLNKVNQALTHGAQLIKVKGPYSNSFHVAKIAAEKFGWVNMTTTFINPYTVEGNKTISYEIIEDLEGRVPDWILVPVGAGPMLAGIWRGLLDLKRMGLISRLPGLVAIQSEHCCPIAVAYKQGGKEVKPWKGDCETAASGIADALDGYSGDGSLTLECIHNSGGSVVTVNEEEIWQSVSILAKSEGIYAEPTGAIAVTGIRKLVEDGIIKANHIVVGIVSGNGLKSSVLPPDCHVEPPVIESAEELADLIISNNCCAR